MKASTILSLSILSILVTSCASAPTVTPIPPATLTPHVVIVTPTPQVVTATSEPTATAALTPTAVIPSWEDHPLIDKPTNIVFPNATQNYVRKEIYGSDIVLEDDTRWVVQAQVDKLKDDVGEASTGIVLQGYTANGNIQNFYLVYQKGKWSIGYSPRNSDNKFSYWETFQNLNDPKQNFELSILDGGNRVSLKNDQGFQVDRVMPERLFDSAQIITSAAQIGPQTKITFSKLLIQTLRKGQTASIFPVNPSPTTPTPMVTTSANGQPEYVFHVAVNGNDTNPGTADQPFATIEHARDVARNLSPNMRGPITVIVHGGMYPVSKTIQFGPEDSGQNGYDIIYRSADGEAPIFSGGINVTGWTKLPGSPLWKTVLPEVKSFRQLYVNGTRAQRAASNQSVTGLGWARGDFSDRDGIAISAANLPDISRPQDLELHWTYDWNDMRLLVKNITKNPDGTKTIWMKQPYFSYALWMSTGDNGNHQWFPKYDVPFYIENALELLDQPGKWYYNSDTGELFYWPRSGEDMNVANVVIPQTQTLLEITGGPVGQEVHNLAFEGLSFAYAGWTRASQRGTFGWQAQNLIKLPCWGMGCVEMTPAHVQVTSAHDIRFEACRFEHLGAVGLSLNNNTFRITIKGNLFRDISDSAIVVGHWDHAYITAPAIQATARDNLLADNLIQDVGSEYWGAPAIAAYYVENLQILHNDISNMPYGGISVGWGWAGTPDSTTSRGNRVANNLITDLHLRARDGGGIYTLGQQPNTVVESNVIRRIRSDDACLRPDEGSAYILFRNNVCDTASKWLNIWNKNIHDIQVISTFTNVQALRNEGVNIQIQNTVTIGGQSWPQEASAIINNAGLEPTYAYLRTWVSTK